MARKFTGIRLSDEGLARVREMAEVETEGNVSQMIRKLLAEAIAHRDHVQPAARQGRR
jgi:hypothetical protein